MNYKNWLWLLLLTPVILYGAWYRDGVREDEPALAGHGHTDLSTWIYNISTSALNKNGSVAWTGDEDGGGNISSNFTDFVTDTRSSYTNLAQWVFNISTTAASKYAANKYNSGAQDFQDVQVYGQSGTASSNFVTKADLDAASPEVLRLWLKSDYTLTDTYSAVSDAETTISDTSVADNTRFLWWSATNVVDVVAKGTFNVHVHVMSDTAKTVGLQAELYVTNTTGGAKVELAEGATHYFIKKNVRCAFDLRVYNSTATNLLASQMFGVAIYVKDDDADTPDIDFYLEGKAVSGAMSDVDVPVSAG
ncbi:MAG: hypothetical protein GY861_25190, partial [bacterium]|nr:hypothetical protein [bacterium]